MQSTNLKKWETTASTYIVKDRWLRLRADTCVTADGRTITPFYVMEYPDWVNCLVVSTDGEVTLLRHYRHGSDAYGLEIPAGYIDVGETPEQAVLRELEEETGLTGAEIVRTGTCYPNPAFMTNKNYCFVAIGGTFHGKVLNELGADFEVVRIPFGDLIAMIGDSPEVFQALHVTNIFFALRELKRRGLPWADI